MVTFFSPADLEQVPEPCKVTQICEINERAERSWKIPSRVDINGS